jgi:hypothetical protein
MSTPRIQKNHWDSSQGIVKNNWIVRPHLPKVVSEIGKFLTLFRNQNEIDVKPDQKPIGEFTNTMLNDRFDLAKENCLNISLGGK